MCVFGGGASSSLTRISEAEKPLCHPSATPEPPQDNPGRRHLLGTVLSAGRANGSGPRAAAPRPLAPAPLFLFSGGGVGRRVDLLARAAEDTAAR